MNSLKEKLELDPITLQLIDLAIAEDLGLGLVPGDVTTRALFGDGALARAQIIARENLIVCGHVVAEAVFRKIDSELEYSITSPDGTSVSAGQPLCHVNGRLSSILAGERVALNFLQRLSGVASLTNRLVNLVQGTAVKLLDTRKTTPGFRMLEKYAVRVGGGHNHRFGLFDAVLIKNNHIDALGGDVDAAVKLAREKTKSGMFIEVEVRNPNELQLALAASPDAILLDNMSPEELSAAVSLVRATHPKGSPLLEASGGINESNLEVYSKTGVDAISLGALTHSVRAVDLSLRYTRVTQ